MSEYLCPFCTNTMKRHIGADRFTYLCEHKLCNHRPFSNYAFSGDDCGTMFHVSILIQLENMYMLTIDFQSHTTSFEKIKVIPEDSSVDYHLAVDMMWINEALEFDFNCPKESSIKIANRLLKLTAFI
jgi:hypothetical protein